MLTNTSKRTNKARIFSLILGLTLVTPGHAVESREIGWEDLVPQVTYDDPFEALTEDQLYDLGTIFRTRELYKRDAPAVSEEMMQRTERIEQELDRQGVDVEGLLAQREEIMEKRMAAASAVVPDLDGENVRMPGYVLPLEFNGQKVTEFFLVPYVGACMHAPTPPPNQMVHVSIEEGIETSGLYDPVWVNGIISTTGKTTEFGFSDGSLDLSAGYTMQALEIMPYE